MATMRQLETALRNADAAGDVDAARKLAAVIQRQRQKIQQDPNLARIAAIPGMEDTVIQELRPKPPESSLGEQIVGDLETGATLVTGATGGTLGFLMGTAEGIINELMSGGETFGTQEGLDKIEQLAMQRAQSLTYAPRTQAGQSRTRQVGEALEPLGNLPPVASGPALATATALPARAQLASAGGDVRQLAGQISGQARQILARRRQGQQEQVSPAQQARMDQRVADAQDLPVPFHLTEGQRTRGFEQQLFEQTTAKNPEAGAPLRERFQEQNEQLQLNMDRFIDETGARLESLQDIGAAVDDALRKRVARDKTRIRSLYKKAEKAGDLQSEVDVSPLANFLNENRASRGENSIMNKVQRQIDVLEVGEGSFEDGSLTLRPMKLSEAEAIRRFINKNTNNADSNDVRIASQIKRTIDAATEEAGGSTYKQARAARKKFADDYENIGLVKNLIDTKRGTSDRRVAVEDVLRKSILQPSADLASVKQLRRVLQTQGEEGRQAWKELQGGTLRFLKEKMLTQQTDAQGNRVVSPAGLDRAIKQLDGNGKLDFLFTQAGAKKLRTLNDVAKTVLTSPPGTINYSNTATVLAAMMDVALSGTTGVPAPVTSTIKLFVDGLKDKKLKARVKRALGENE